MLETNRDARHRPYGWPADDDVPKPFQAQNLLVSVTNALDNRFNERRTGERATGNYQFDYTPASGEQRIFPFRTFLTLRTLRTNSSSSRRQFSGRGAAHEPRIATQRDEIET
jgi:hypothetical protein